MSSYEEEQKRLLALWEEEEEKCIGSESDNEKDQVSESEHNTYSAV